MTLYCAHTTGTIMQHDSVPMISWLVIVTYIITGYTQIAWSKITKAEFKWLEAWLSSVSNNMKKHFYT